MKKLWMFEVRDFSINRKSGKTIFIFRKIPENSRESLRPARDPSTRPVQKRHFRPANGDATGPDQLALVSPSFPWSSLPSIVAGKARSD
jgi:hypothetical protein